MLLLAGEASGDEHGAAVADALRKRRPDLRLLGTGGPRMRESGVELIAGLDDLAVMGFAEVLPRIPFFRRLERKVTALLEDPAVKLVVPIDYPGFNMRIARAASRRGRPVLYYIAPKVWAWRSGRARRLAATTDRVAVILPFEQDFLSRFGVRAEHVGHPLVDHSGGVEDEAELRERWGLDPERPLLALLPGSRAQEIRRHLELFVEAARRVTAARPDVLPVVSRAPNLPVYMFAGLELPVVDGGRALLRHARAALVKSGTGTLEAAVEGTATVVAYRTSMLTWAVAKRLVRTRHIALPNLVAGERVVPEYVQGAATPNALAQALIPLLDDTPKRAQQVADLEAVRCALGEPGAAERVAVIALELIGEPS